MLCRLGDVGKSYLNAGLSGRKCRDWSVVDTYVAVNDFTHCINARESHVDQSRRCKTAILNLFQRSIDRC